jgi:hypothetical protein
MDIENLLPLTPAVFYTLPALAEGDRHGYAIMQWGSALLRGIRRCHCSGVAQADKKRAHPLRCRRTGNTNAWPDLN